MTKYKERPTPKTARMAWDMFLQTRVRTAQPVGMWLTFMSYWVWVMKWSDGEYEEIERHEVWHQMDWIRNRKLNQQ